MCVLYLSLRRRFRVTGSMVTVNVYTASTGRLKGKVAWLRQSFSGLRLSLRSDPPEEEEPATKAGEEIDQLRKENQRLKEKEKE